MNLAASIDFQALMEPVARHFFGDPNIALSKQGKELRWGARGSLSVNCEKGTWFNHETNAGGGVLDMIRSETGRDHANCIAWLQQQKFVLNGASHGGSHSKATIARPKPRIVCTYEYTDEFGALLYEVVRFEPKDFRQRRPDGLGGWIWNLDDTRRVLYRLPELIELRALDHPIFIVEGEKDVENLRALNIPATTNAGGAGKWRDEYSECFSGADVVVIPDNDDAGRNHAAQVAHSLTGIAARVRVLDLAVHWPGCPSKCDVSDLLDTGQTREQLDALIDRAPDATTWVKRRKLDGSGSTQPSSEKIAHWDDPDWSILDDRRGELPEFPINTLSPSCREWVERAAHGAGVTAAHVAIPLIGIASSLIGTARRVQASRSFTQPMTCWAAILGFSGTGKTPGIDATKRALWLVERNRKENINDMRRAHETRRETARAMRDAWTKQLKDIAADNVVDLQKYRSTATAEPAMPKEAEDPGPFVAPQLHVSNATIERLAQILQVQPQGALLLSDELAGLFLNMSRYSGGQDNEFWLEAWNGGHYTVERMSRPAVSIDRLLIGVVGGMQPDKLARSFAGDSDGMTARFLYAWPPEPGYKPLSNDVAEVEPEIVNALTRLVGLPSSHDKDEGAPGPLYASLKEVEFAPRAVPLSSLAFERFEQFRQFVHAGKASLDGREREWWAKMPAHALRLAGTLCFLEWAFVGGQEPTEIDAVFMQAAVHLVRDYFWPHGRAAFRQIGLTERHATERRVLRWIAAHKKIAISLKDVRRDALGQSLDAEHTAALLDRLEKAGWLRKEMENPSGRSGGRPTYRWAVNPQLYLCGAGTAETAETW